MRTFRARLRDCVVDRSNNQFLRDLGVSFLFLTVALLVQSSVLYPNTLFQHLIGVCIGFALGYGIRSVNAVRRAQRQ